MTSIYTTLRTDKAYKIYDGYLYEVTGEECEEALDLVLPKILFLRILKHVAIHFCLMKTVAFLMK